MLRAILAVIFILFAPEAKAQDIFANPPLDARLRAAGMDIESNIMTLHTGDIQRFCGDNYGCFDNTKPDGVCRVYIYLILPEELKSALQRNLMAQCAGWTPPD